MVGRDKGYRRGASRPARARVRRRLAGLLVTLQGPKFTLGEPKSAAAAILQRSPARCMQRAYRNSKGFGAFNHRPRPVGIRKTGKFRPDFSLTILIASFIGKLQKVAPGATREIWNRPALEFHSIRVPGQLVYQANSRTGSITVPGQLAYRVN